jgi:inorganic triphosphatase YgiF
MIEAALDLGAVIAGDGQEEICELNWNCASRA